MPYKDPIVRSRKSSERNLAWRKRNPEKAKLALHRWQENNPDYFLWRSAKKRAKRDGIEFTITRADIPPIPAICPIALIPIKRKEYRGGNHQGPWNHSPSLDRVDPTKGYTPNNIRVVSHKGNRWKGDMTVTDMERLLEYMKEN